MATTPYPFVAGAVLTASQLNSTFNVPINAQTASYVLVASDAGKRVQMNAAGATTITVNTSLFSAGDSLFIQNIGAGTCTITAGTATVTTAGSLALAQWGGGTLYFTSASAAVFFSGAGSGYGTATGGSSSSITVGGVAYTLLSFTSDSNLVVSKAGLFDVLMFGGGAAGVGYGTTAAAGGGAGAGGIVTTTVYLPAATHAVVVGAGGATTAINAQTSGSFGKASTIGAITNCYVSAVGGFGYNSPVDGSGQGVIGCGAGSLAAGSNGGVNNPQGYKGGNAPGTLGSAGGGGGTTAVGANSASATVGGAGGAGYDVSAFIAGRALFKGGGGGGGGTTGGAGGSSVGGAGGAGAGAGAAAAANTGSGGGGAGPSTQTGGAGGSGIVYVRFKS